MEGVEDIPGAVLDEGIPWGWETFREYLDAWSADHDIDLARSSPTGRCGSTSLVSGTLDRTGVAGGHCVHARLATRGDRAGASDSPPRGR